jgi:hypothetical protein
VEVAKAQNWAVEPQEKKNVGTQVKYSIPLLYRRDFSLKMYPHHEMPYVNSIFLSLPYYELICVTAEIFWSIVVRETPIFIHKKQSRYTEIN